ncbi:MAG: haloacid dehalogenase [Pirellula sp.]|nr:haloacid dehalogenase [Pirellula sp.]
MYRLLALDIDGTLVNSRDELTPGVRDALQEAAAEGIRIVLATGRRYSRALPLVEPLGIDAPIISASGALIKCPLSHRTLHVAALSRADLLKTLEVTTKRGHDAVLYGDTYDQGFDYYFHSFDGICPELGQYHALNEGCGRVTPDLYANPPEDVFAGFAMGSRSEMLALDDALQAALPGRLYTHVIRSPRYDGFMCEIAPAGATKWSGVRYVADLWGIADEEICAVGDDVNDLPMLVGSGLGVAMGNAVDELKQAADRIAPHHDEDGLAEVVRWILAGK